MKNALYLLMLVCASFTILACGDPWVAKIDGDKITLEKFNNYYYSFHKSNYGKDTTNEEIDQKAGNAREIGRNPLLDKNKFLDEMIHNHLVMKQIEKDNYLEEKEDLSQMLKLHREGLIANFYAREKFGDQLQVTEEEISKVYESQINVFQNQPIERVEQYIRQQLIQRKFLELGNELVNELKANATIEKEKEIINKLDANESLDDKTIVFKINDKEYSVLDFKKMYYSQLRLQFNLSDERINEMRKNPDMEKQNPLFVPSKFIEQFIRTHLTALKAEEDKFLEKNPTISTLIEIRIQRAIMQSYLIDKFQKKVVPTQDEIASVYQKYIDRFQNVPVEKAEEVISQNIEKQKFQREVMTYVLELKEQSKIEKNKESFETESEK